MRTLKTISLLMLILFIAQSCATILAGSKSPVRVTGEPAKAKVYYNGSYVGEAPVNVKVPRGKRENSKIEIKAENYKPTQVEVSSKISLGYLGLDILTGVFPLVIDFATGNIYAPYPKKINYQLEVASGVSSKFKKGDEVLILTDKYKDIKGTITEILSDGVKVKFTRPATLIEKQTKKVDQVTEEKKFNFSEIKKM